MARCSGPVLPLGRAEGGGAGNAVCLCGVAPQPDVAGGVCARRWRSLAVGVCAAVCGSPPHADAVPLSLTALCLRPVAVGGTFPPAPLPRTRSAHRLFLPSLACAPATFYSTLSHLHLPFLRHAQDRYHQRGGPDSGPGGSRHLQLLRVDGRRLGAPRSPHRWRPPPPRPACARRVRLSAPSFPPSPAPSSPPTSLTSTPPSTVLWAPGGTFGTTRRCGFGANLTSLGRLPRCGTDAAQAVDSAFTVSQPVLVVRHVLVCGRVGDPPSVLPRRPPQVARHPHQARGAAGLSTGLPRPVSPLFVLGARRGRGGQPVDCRRGGGCGRPLRPHHHARVSAAPGLRDAAGGADGGGARGGRPGRARRGPLGPH